MGINYRSFSNYFLKSWQFCTTYMDGFFHIFILPQFQKISNRSISLKKNLLQTEPMRVSPFLEVYFTTDNLSESSHKAIQKIRNAKLLKINIL